MVNVVHPPIKIMYLITGLRLGGAEHQLLLMAGYMIDAGHDVTVVAMESGGVMANKFREKGINVAELDMQGLKSALKGYSKLNQLIKEQKPDLIHAHMIHANLLSRIYIYLKSKGK